MGKTPLSFSVYVKEIRIQSQSLTNLFFMQKELYLKKNCFKTKI